MCEYENFFPEKKKAVIDLSFKLSYRGIRLWTIHLKETQLRQILKQKTYR